MSVCGSAARSASEYCCGLSTSPDDGRAGRSPGRASGRSRSPCRCGTGRPTAADSPAPSGRVAPRSPGTAARSTRRAPRGCPVPPGRTRLAARPAGPLGPTGPARHRFRRRRSMPLPQNHHITAGRVAPADRREVLWFVISSSPTHRAAEVADKAAAQPVEAGHVSLLPTWRPARRSQETPSEQACDPPD